MNTVSGPAIKDLLETAINSGYISRIEASGIGIDPEKLSDPLLRLEEEKLIQLWNVLDSKATDTPIGLHIGRTINPSAKGLLASWVSQASNLGEAFSIFRKNIALMNPSESWMIEKSNGLCRLTFSFITDGYPSIAIERSMAALVSWARALSHHDMPIIRSEFTFPKPVYCDELHQIFGKQTFFDCRRNALAFEESLLTLSISGSNQYLKEMLQDQAKEQLSYLKKSLTTTQRIISFIDMKLKSGERPSIKNACSELGMSRQTLYRKLKIEATDFETLFDHYRLELAHNLLIEKNKNPQECALILGFKDLSAFHKAFKRWYQTTPGVYQEQHKSKLISKT